MPRERRAWRRGCRVASTAAAGAIDEVGRFVTIRAPLGDVPIERFAELDEAVAGLRPRDASTESALHEASIDDLTPEQQRVLLGLHRMGGRATARQLAGKLVMGENEVRGTLFELEGDWVELITDARTRMMSATIPPDVALAIQEHLRRLRGP